MQITDAELAVMRVVWARPGLSAADIHTALEGDQNWSRQTVKTLLARLTEKGALKAEPEGRRFLYSALLRQTDYEARATERFVDKVYRGRAAPLVAHLADSKGLTDDDIAELESLIERLKS
ncbi:MAG: BlaI/MecI/CopY family transcriptional regulator [Pseudomonadota bacterium]